MDNGGGYQRATDPWVTFGPTGIAYRLSLSFNDVAPPITAFDFDHALLASRSTDGGVTWSEPVAVIRDTAPTVFNDKQTITADPTDASYVHAVWDRPRLRASARASSPRSERDRSAARPGSRRSIRRRPLVGARRGRSSTPVSSTRRSATRSAVQPNGTLIDIFTEFNNENAKKTWRPSASFARPTRARPGQGRSDVGRLGTIGNFDPETGDPVRTGDIIPDIAVDSSATPARGRLYAVSQDASLNGGQADAVAFSQSLDGGLTWSPAVKVNKTPTGIPIANQQAFTPSVDVGADGTIAVTYYDFRSNTPAHRS